MQEKMQITVTPAKKASVVDAASKGESLSTPFLTSEAKQGTPTGSMIAVNSATTSIKESKGSKKAGISIKLLPKMDLPKMMELPKSLSTVTMMVTAAQLNMLVKKLEEARADGRWNHGKDSVLVHCRKIMDATTPLLQSGAPDERPGLELTPTPPYGSPVQPAQLASASPEAEQTNVNFPSPSANSAQEANSSATDGDSLSKEARARLRVYVALAQYNWQVVGSGLEAKANVDRALEVQPDSFDARYLAASIAIAEGKSNALQVAYRHLCSLHYKPEEFGKPALMREKLATTKAYRLSILFDALVLRGSIARQLGQYQPSVEAYQEALRILGNGPVPHQSLGAFVELQAKYPSALLLAGRSLEALSHIRKVLYKTPKGLPASASKPLARLYASILTRCFLPALVPYEPPPPRPPPSKKELSLPSVSKATKPDAKDEVERYVPASALQEATLLFQLEFRKDEIAAQRPNAPVEGIQSALTDKENKATERELAIVLYTSGNLPAISSMYRKSLGQNLTDGKRWYMLALSETAVGNYDSAYVAITQAIKRRDDDVMQLLFAGKLCLKHLQRAGEAVKYAERALELLSPSDVQGTPQARPNRVARFTARLLFAASASTHAPTLPSFTERRALMKRALAVLKDASTTHPEHPRVWLLTAILRADIREPVAKIKEPLLRALDFDRRNSIAWLTLALLLSSERRMQEALVACAHGLTALGLTSPLDETEARADLNRLLTIPQKGHDALRLLLVKASLQSEATESRQEVLQTYTIITQLLFPTQVFLDRSLPQFSPRPTFQPPATPAPRTTTEPYSPGVGRLPSGRPAIVRPATSPVSQTGSGTSGDRSPDNKSSEEAETSDTEYLAERMECLFALARLYGKWAAGRPLLPNKTREALLSDALRCLHKARMLVDIHMGNGQQKTQTEVLDRFSIRLHLELGLLSTRNGRVARRACSAPATACIKTPSSTMSLLSTRNGVYQDAFKHYETALSLDSHDVEALVGLARLIMETGSDPVLAHEHLVTALSADATSHEAWYLMGLVFQAKGKHDAASEHFLTALELEHTAPTLPYARIPRHF
eukprot:g77499.t1